jgi:hypothetical protein
VAEEESFIIYVSNNYYVKIYAAVPIIIGLALMFAASVDSKIAYAQVRMGLSSNGVPVPLTGLVFLSKDPPKLTHDVD